MKAALLGLGRGGRALARVLLRSSWCELVCIASERADQLARMVTEHPGISTGNDFRLAVVSRPIDVLFVAIPPFQRLDYLRIAAERRIPTWLLSPPLHRYDALAQTVELYARREVPIAAARAWGIESALRPEAATLGQLGPILLAEGRLSTCWANDLHWRGDAARAGGGVLLEGAYLMADALVQLLGVPTSVLGVTARVPASRAPAVYDTEDTAAIVCRYTQGPVATLTACRRSGPDEWSLRLSGRDASMWITDDRVVVRDSAGRELFRHPRGDLLAEQVEDFMSGLHTRVGKVCHPLHEHLATMSVVQAAYLSSRTGHPEAPATISQAHLLR